MRPSRRSGPAACALALACLLGSARVASAKPIGDVPAPSGAAGSRAPSAVPLLGPGSAAGGDEPQAGGSAGAETDPLVSNGLSSPLCSGAPGGSALSPASRRNCESSAFVGAAAPTGNFGIDVHIDTGFLGLSSASLLAIVQDLFVTPLWTALVWAVHALVVMLEWCFTLDLLAGSSLRGGVAQSLHELQRAVTVPWLALVLAAGAVLCAYHGLVRRRVAESVAQALVALAMTGAGIAATVDPADTVGALGEWANDASVGTLAVSTSGSARDAGGALADGMGAVFATAIEVPWCYLEFGDVDWCRSRSRLDPRLRAAATTLARSELQQAGCSAPAACRGSEAGALLRSARLLRAADSNGAIFLALPPNGPERNAINDPGSLLRAICRTDEATGCTGPAAAEAEFRTNRGTWPRVAGLLLIAAGLLGLLLLLGFIAVRLLGAALFALLYLMLAPAVALAPALGEAGRAAFRRWAANLLGAVVSKLMFAFLLGVILAIVSLLGQLQALGWWTRWLLMSAFWWGTFVRRHQLLQFAAPELRAGRTHERRPLLRRIEESLGAHALTYDRIRSARERFRKRAPELPEAPASRAAAGRPRRHAAIGGAPGGSGQAREDGPARRLTAGAGPPVAGEPAGAGRSSAPQRVPPGAQGGEATERISAERDRALAAGNLRRAALLAGRPAAGRRGGTDASPPPGDRHGASDHERGVRYLRFLSAQARLPAGAGDGSDRRSYRALAGLAGYGSREYARLPRGDKGLAREAIDRELALHRERAPTSVRRPPPQLAGDEQGATGSPLIPARWQPRRVPPRPGGREPSESVVMRDAREIADRRRRQLGRGPR